MGTKATRTSFSADEEVYFRDQEEKFELISCPLKGAYCDVLRPELNRKYADSQLYIRNRQFVQAMSELKSAYYKTYDLPGAPCGKCAAFFRSELMDSMENMKDELKRMSSGWFKNNRYKPVYEEVKSSVNELKSEKDSFKNVV